MKNPSELSDEELLAEYESCQEDWSKYSCDSFGFYIEALRKEVETRGLFIRK